MVNGRGVCIVFKVLTNYSASYQVLAKITHVSFKNMQKSYAKVLRLLSFEAAVFILCTVMAHSDSK